MNEELVQLTLPMGAAPRTQDAHGLVAGPECSAWASVAVVQGELCFVKRHLDPGTVAKRIYEARNRGDVEAVLAELDPDVEWLPHFATLSGQPIRGHEGVREYMASLHEEWEMFYQEPEQFIDAGDRVVAFVRTCARGRASGADVELRVAHVLTFEGGKCLGYVSYRDREEALKVTGLEE